MALCGWACVGTITIFRLLWIPPKTLLKVNQAAPKNTCQNFPTPKNLQIENFKPKKSFDHPCHLKSGVPLPGGREFPLLQSALNVTKAFWGQLSQLFFFAVVYRASDISRKKKQNFAGFSGANSRKNRPISRDFRGKKVKICGKIGQFR